METGTELTVVQKAQVALAFDATKQEFTALAEASKPIVAITNDASYQELHAARMRLVKARTNTTKRGKSIREDAQAFAKTVIDMEKQLLGIIQPEETRLQSIQDTFDASEEARKQAAAQAEANRIKAHQDAIERINRLPMEFVGKPSASIKFALENASTVPVDDNFEEFQPLAQAAKDKAIQALEQLHAGAIVVEQAAADHAARIKSEREELDRLRRDQAKRDEEAKEKAQADNARIAQDRAQADAAAKVIAEAQAVESKRLRDEQARIDAERIRIDRQRADFMEEQAKAEREKIRQEELARIDRERIANEAEAKRVQNAIDLTERAQITKTAADGRGSQVETTGGHAAAPSIAAARDAGDVTDISPAVVTAKDQPAATLPDREALILTFMAQDDFRMPRNQAQLVHLLRAFFDFCDKFKVK